MRRCHNCGKLRVTETRQCPYCPSTQSHYEPDEQEYAAMLAEIQAGWSVEQERSRQVCPPPPGEVPRVGHCTGGRRRTKDVTGR